MKTIVIALALITNSVFTSLLTTSGFQRPASSKEPIIQVRALYDKKKDVTKLSLPPLLLWRNRSADQSEQVRLFVEFECPKTKIVRPKEVLFTFNAQSHNFISFPSREFSVSIDGELLKLGNLKGDQRRQIHPSSLTVYDDESIAISYEDFTRIATANEVTIIVGKRKFDLTSDYIRLLREFHKLMQREGEELSN